jgi:hypothetical protein
LDHREARDVSTRPRKAPYEAELNGIDSDLKDDGDGLCRRLGGSGRWRPAQGDDHRYLPPNQIGCQRRQPVENILRPTVLDP